MVTYKDVTQLSDIHRQLQSIVLSPPSSLSTRECDDLLYLRDFYQKWYLVKKNLFSLQRAQREPTRAQREGLLS